MTIEYTKVDASDPLVLEVAKQSGVSAKEVATMVNQQRYRSAYNKLQQQRMKVVRKLVKEHPELLAGK